MATIINADTSNGLKLTSDTSGIIELQSGGTTKATVNSSGLTSSGHILQVVSVTKDTSFTTTSGSFVDITGLSVAITPSATSSKILVLMNVASSNTTSTGTAFTQLVRGTTAISIGASGETGEPTTGYTAQAGYDMGQVAVQYLDSPSTTSATTYKLQLRGNGSQTAAINRTGEYQSQQGNVASGITLMEVAG
jgi:hypothetical protein